MLDPLISPPTQDRRTTQARPYIYLYLGGANVSSAPRSDIDIKGEHSSRHSQPPISGPSSARCLAPPHRSHLAGTDSRPVQG
eukprot:scaffold6336_cov112-Isochrysis_galbana.AAC.5